MVRRSAFALIVLIVILLAGCGMTSITTRPSSIATPTLTMLPATTPTATTASPAGPMATATVAAAPSIPEPEGVGWKPVTFPPGDGNVNTVAFAPSQSTIAYTCINGGGQRGPLALGVSQ